MRIEYIYNKMIEAANKATQASDEYTEEDARIEARVANMNRYPALDKVDRVRVMDQEKENSQILIKAFNRYKFWKGEQERLCVLLQAQAAYVYCKRVARTELSKHIEGTKLI